MANEIIILKQNSVIEYSQLNEVIEKAEQKITELNIESIEPTNENKAKLKEIRTSLNADFKEYEAARKEIKSLVEQPYKDFEKEYNRLKIVFTNAETVLKKTIDSIEDKQKDEKRKELEDFFKAEKEKAEVPIKLLKLNLDFIKLDDVNLNITITASMNKMKEEITNYITGVTEDLYKIVESEDKAKLYVKYLNHRSLEAATEELQKEKEAEAAVVVEEKPEQPTVDPTPTIVEKEETKPEIKTVEHSPITIVSFIIEDTQENISKVRDYLKENKINFKIKMGG